MHLNKNGWGFIQMIWMSAIILVFFTLAIVLIYRFYSSLDWNFNVQSETVDERSYYEIEIDLEKASIKYMDDNYANISDVGTIRLSMERLFKAGYFLEEFYNKCDGYTLTSKNNGYVDTKAYITCDNYTTKGFN